jgi:predicted ATPase/DNA-binding NarL/FixJ family response regulator
LTLEKVSSRSTVHGDSPRRPAVRTIQSPSLPTPPTALVGRDRERAAVVDTLRRADVRLVTLLGAGGVGKTRLALAVAEELRSVFDDRVYMVDLSALVDASLVLSTIAGALGVAQSVDRDLLDQLARRLRMQSTLLVLDNFEQVIEAAPDLARLLAAAPQIKMLVTSRAALRISAEHEFPVPPLELPAPDRLSDPDSVTQCEAVALFIARARAVKPDFEILPASAPILAEMCARLDGLPLAIELAAARIKLLTPQALLARLSHRLPLLTGGARDLPARHKTLRSTIDWSYDLLSPQEQALFTRLAVFNGGWCLQAVESVLVLDTDQALDGLAALVDRSLLRQWETADGEPRYSMLETLREYASERLESDEQADVWRERHAEYFLSLARDGARELNGARQAAWLEQLEYEHDNLRAAITWSLQLDRPLLGLGLTATLAHFWAVRNHLTEGQMLLETALNRWPNAPASARAEALTSAGYLAYCVDDLDRAAKLLEQSLELRRALDDEFGLAHTVHQLGRVEHYRQRFDRAALLYDESLSIRRRQGDRHGIALTLNSAGVLARDRGDLERARVCFDESLAELRALGATWGIALALNNLARVARDQQLWDLMHELCTESFDCFKALRDPMGLAWILSNLTIAARLQGAWDKAARLHGATEVHREAIDVHIISFSPSERASYASAVADIRAHLGDEAFEAAVANGRGMTAEDAFSLVGGADVSEVRASEQEDSSIGIAAAMPLTRRELEVTTLVALGFTDRQIAQELVITEGTVGVHLTRIFNKLDLHTRSELAVWAAQHGLLPEQSNSPQP